jgi:LmbE family N-acetylglucosaminyl deacetylase
MRVLAIGAQPGEIEFACGGTLARYAQRNDIVSMVCISNGNLSHDAIAPDELAEMRYDESKKAAEALGAELHWLGNSDFAIYDEPVTTMKLVEIIREFRPDVLITHSSTDHRVDHSSTHALTLRASANATVPQLEGANPPTESAMPILEMDTLFGIGFEPVEYVDISEVIDAKRAAIECHDAHLDFLSRVHGRDLVEEFMTVARYRGLQCGSGYAESFCTTRRSGRLRAERLLP